MDRKERQKITEGGEKSVKAKKGKGSSIVKKIKEAVGHGRFTEE